MSLAYALIKNCNCFVTYTIVISIVLRAIGTKLFLIVSIV